MQVQGNIANKILLTNIVLMVCTLFGKMMSRPTVKYDSLFFELITLSRLQVSILTALVIGGLGPRKA